MPTVEELLAQKEMIDYNVNKQKEVEQMRIQSAVQMENSRNRAELIRMAHSTILANKSVMPVDQRQITAEEILAFAKTLEEGWEQ